jgi:hypothetical protein
MNETMIELNKRKLIKDMAKFSISGLINEAMFKYAAIKGINLHFTFSHPASKQIFEMNKESIKARLREFWSENLEQIKTLGITFKNISCEVIYCLPRDMKAIQEERKPYIEPSNGSFENKAKNPSVKLAFERKKLRAVKSKRAYKFNSRYGR